MPSTIKLTMLLVVGLLVASLSWAAQTQTSLELANLPPVVVTTQAQTATVLATDPGTSGSKRATVVSCTTVDGYPFVLLVRVQRAGNGVFVDIVGEATIGELTTRVTAMTITGSSHPATAKDAIDTAVLADAAD